MDLNTLREYLNIHLISLEQDIEKLSDEMEAVDINSKAFNDMDCEYNNLSGQSIAIQHILGVINE